LGKGGEKMKNVKNVVLAIMVTFVFTATILSIIPTQSAITKTYNPWADINHDGTVSLSDLVLLANSYGASGNPTAPVNVTNPSINVTVTNPVLTVNGTDTQNVNVTNWPSNTGYGLPPGTFNASCAIQIISNSAGVACGGSPLYFVFQPASDNFTVTTIAIDIIATSRNGGETDPIFLNGQSVGSIGFNGGGITQCQGMTFATTQPLQANLNTLTVNGNVWVLQITMCVNYQYTR
jgi:hypothetical protein